MHSSQRTHQILAVVGSNVFEYDVLAKQPCFASSNAIRDLTGSQGVHIRCTQAGRIVEVQFAWQKKTGLCKSGFNIGFCTTARSADARQVNQQALPWRVPASPLSFSCRTRRFSLCFRFIALSRPPQKGSCAPALTESWSASECTFPRPVSVSASVRHSRRSIGPPGKRRWSRSRPAPLGRILARRM